LFINKLVFSKSVSAKNISPSPL